MSPELSNKEVSNTPNISIVIPVKNEAGNLKTLVEEIEETLTNQEHFEVIYVDDGSTDGTSEVLNALSESRPWLRRLSHGTSFGQSAAIRSGARAATGSIIVTLDGDGQNNPKYIPALVKTLRAGNGRTGLVAGQRRARKDSGFKKFQSRIANRVRSRILGDGAIDTGCGLKAFWRDVYLALPYFDGLHRFMPALVIREGYSIEFVDVVDRPRQTGRSNYGLMDRFWIGMIDLAGVYWLMRRKRRQTQASGTNAHDR